MAGRRRAGESPAPKAAGSTAQDSAFDRLVELVLDGRLGSVAGSHALPREADDGAPLFATVLDALPALVSYLSPEGTYRWVNRRYEEWFGVAREHLLGRAVGELLGEDLYAAAAPHLSRALSGEPARWQRQAPHPVTGDLRWLDVSYTPDRDSEGRLRGVVAMVRDITAEVRAQRALSEHQTRLEREVSDRSAAAWHAEAQLRLILESTADGVFGVDQDGRLSFVNATACTLLGLSPEAMMGRPVDDLFDGSGRAAEALRATLATGEPSRVENALLARAGAEALPVRLEVRAMRSGETIVGAVVSFSDITDRLAAERAREAALQEAERLARLRTEFLTNMSHEIRTPLNAVLGLAEVAARGDRDRTPEETFRMILDSGQVLLGVVNDILDFAKIEAGKLRIDRQPFELGPVIDRAVALVAPRVFAKGLHFWVDEGPGLPRQLTGDPLRLTQVLGNLLSNAQKFTETGGIELRVWCDSRDLWFSVRDSGIGIAAGPLQRLFSPFEQADSSTTRRFGGSGLGLVISKHLLQMMGGDIGVRSEPGVGSTFTIRLPMVDPQAGPQHRRYGRILLAGPVSQAHVGEALRQQGFDVRYLPAGDALVEPVDLVVLPADSLQDERLVDLAIAAVRADRRLAVVTNALAAELPRPLRGRATLLEAPLRARHVAACLEDSRRPPETPPPEEPQGRLAHLKVLAAEDNEVNALVLEAIMRMEGASLELVENGYLAVRKVEACGPGHFDLVLTDIQMPEMDGYEATQEILRMDPQLPVVGLTAHAMPEEKERCLAVGMVDHLPKPVDVEQLVAVARKHARRRGP